MNARAVLDDLDSHGIARAVLVGHSFGGGVALSAASLAPGRVAAVVLLASVGPGCITGWDRLLAAPGAGRLCAQMAWRLTPWMARARLAGIARRRGRPLRPDEHVNWQVWGHAGHGRHPLWRTFREQFTITVPGGRDMELAGDLLSHEFSIERDGQAVATISKRWLSLTGSYAVDVAPGENDVLVLSSVLALDLAMDQQRHAA